MPKGFHGKILFVDLTNRTSEIKTFKEDFYRKYLGGGSFGAYFLLKNTDADTDPLDPQNVLTIAPSVTTGVAVSGVSRCCMSALSPVTNMVADSQSGGNIGPAIKRAGLDAVVITGKSSSPVYLYIQPDDIQIRDASHLWTKPVTQVHDELESELGKKGLCIAQCGPAGEKLVRFACVMVDHNDVFGRTGLGAVMGSKNLRAVVIKENRKIPFADPQLLKTLAQKANARLPDAGFPATLRKYGTPGVLSNQASVGNLATKNHSRSFHPEHEKLDGSHFEDELGAGSSTCYGCVVRCRKKVKAKSPFPLTEKLGGPEFETLGLMGSNLDMVDPAAVAYASQKCGEYGMDTITMGALAAMTMECYEHGIISKDDLGGIDLKWGCAEGLFQLIDKVGQREGIGDIIAEGFTAFVDRYGPEAEPYAIHVKNQGLAVHMPQVKPSLALMYAACPIGPDHQSSEHDWLLASGGQDAKALGIVGQGDAASEGLPKVRMTVYSQIYYSLLDNLSLCQFCWGPGNLFSYRDLEDLLLATTGWQVSMWELMKCGERRLAMQRQVNARRGYGSKDDRLPARLFDPLPDGPAAGRSVNKKRFPQMLREFYGMLGWDMDTGNPREAKLVELGLDWAM